MLPAARRSAWIAREMVASVPRTMTRSASALMETFAAVFALRTWPRTAAAVCSTTGSPAPPRAPVPPAPPAPPTPPRSAAGHGARWTDPSCHQDHTSSVTNGMNGANSRSSTSSAERSAPLTDSAPAPAPAPEPYARALTSSR